MGGAGEAGRALNHEKALQACHDRNRRATAWWILTVLYLLVGASTILVALCTHEVRPECAGKSLHIHLDTFRTCLLIVGYRPFRALNTYTIWDFCAIVQVIIFSALLYVETELLRWKWYVFALLLVSGTGAAALIGVGCGLEQLYKVALPATILLLTFADLIAFCGKRRESLLHPRNPDLRNDTALFLTIICTVDVPVILGFTVLYGATGWWDRPMTDYYEPFFSGAVAFQLVSANAAIFLLRVLRQCRTFRRFPKLEHTDAPGASAPA